MGVEKFEVEIQYTVKIPGSREVPPVYVDPTPTGWCVFGSRVPTHVSDADYPSVEKALTAAKAVLKETS